jgi:DNA invertase Pin-like site-specific DNA recombinase
MNNQVPYGYTHNEQRTGYQISPVEAAEVRRMFEQAAAGDVTIYSRTSALSKEDTPKRAAIYARVAVQSQAGQTAGALELQVNGCISYCQEHGYTVEHVYREAFSGAKLDRPMLNKLRQAAREEQFDVLVIWDFNRLARRAALQTLLIRELDEAGITIQSVCDGTEEEITCFITTIKAHMAEVQRERIQARTQRSKAAARQQKEQHH